LILVYRELKTYGPKSAQPKINREPSELTEGEKIVYDAFNNPEFVAKLIDFLTLEENKGKDKFSHKKMVLFKVIIACNVNVKDKFVSSLPT